jgi:NTP pyrophosphatase (non-canonical NTP hydrolase)
MPLNEPFMSLLEQYSEDTTKEKDSGEQLAAIFSSDGHGHLFVGEIIHGVMAMTIGCHGLAKRAGWWNDPATGEPKDRNDGELIALMHSELSEALEGIRKNSNDDHLPHRKSVEVELADTLIRIFDYAGARNLDLAGAVIEKLAFNQRRADHKPAARLEADGKKF